MEIIWEMILMKRIPTTKRIEKDLNDLLKNYDIDNANFVKVSGIVQQLAFIGSQLLRVQQEIIQKNEQSEDGLGGLIQPGGKNGRKMSGEMLTLNTLQALYNKNVATLWRIVKDSDKKNVAKVNPLDGFLTQYKDE